jgi:predicted nucleic acid-binding protein
VLGRAKFFKYADFTLNSPLRFAVIPEITTKYYPEIELDVLEDVSDNKFLELAVTCGANYLITGNTKHFPMKSFGATLIVTPKDYWETHH